MPIEPESETLTPSRHLTLTVVDAIGLALDNNLGIQQAYLGRASARLSLATAEDKFSPLIGVQGTAEVEGGDISTTTISTSYGQFQVIVFDDVRQQDDMVTWNASLGPIVTWLLPTGADVQLSFQAEVNDSTTREVVAPASDYTMNAYGGNVGLSISQPLLKGAGIDVNNAPIRIARINDRQNLLSVRSTVEQTVAQAIREYRAVVQAKAEVGIAEQALAAARRNLSDNQLRVTAGSQPATELVQYQTQILQTQIALRQAELALQNSRRTLATTLGQPLDSEIEIGAFDPRVDRIQIDFNKALNIALHNRGDYEQAKLAKDAAQIALFLAENNCLWDVSLVAGLNANIGDTRDIGWAVGAGLTRYTTRDEQYGWNIGLNIVIPVDDNDQAKRAVEQVGIALNQVEVSLRDTRQSIALDVRNSIANVDSAWDEIQLSEQALQLARQQYEIALEKLKYGRVTTFEAISLDNAYQATRKQRLDSQIDYLDALTDLDLALGTTLRTWNIAIGDPTLVGSQRENARYE